MNMLHRGGGGVCQLTHLPKRHPETTSKLQAVIFFQNTQCRGCHSHPIQHPTQGLSPAPSSEHKQGSNCWSQLPQLKSFCPREEDSMGRCRMEVPPLSLLPWDAVLVLSATCHAPALC